MCGITGRLNYQPDRPASAELIRRMNHVLRHRGPDDEGVFIRNNVGLGQQRLAIIDTSERGHQPMCNEDGTIWITFNGEIYNHPELRAGLEARGHVFRSNSDTEAIVHLYEEKGVDCLRDLRGMFAFALWDSRCRRLVLARDRMGQKPLFYAEHDQGLLFASEIKAILQAEGFPRTLNPESLHHFLTYKYVPPPHTMFSGIWELPPAHFLVWEDTGYRVERYWSLSYADKLELSEEDTLERLDAILDEAVRIRLISDVPLGVFLSGGIDSSLVVAYMSRHSSEPIKTFSIGFTEAGYNELPFARAVAEQYKTDHHEFVVEADALSILPKLIWHFDQPFADSSAVPTYYVAQLARQHVTVALNGDGGDEAFAGYGRYLGYYILQRYNRTPAVLRRAAQHILERLPVQQRKGTFWTQFNWLNVSSLAPLDGQYVRSIATFSKTHKLGLYTPAFRQQLNGCDSIAYMQSLFDDPALDNLLDCMLRADTLAYLPGDLLVKVDRMSMAHSLEPRSPFLDHVLVEFAASLPAKIKFRRGRLKHLLKQLARDKLSREIIERQKRGFAMPVGKWVREELRPVIEEYLLSSHLAREELLRQSAINKLWWEHRDQEWRNVHGERLWALLNLELWFRTFIESTPVMEPAV